jgi:hypothetical protein
MNPYFNWRVCACVCENGGMLWYVDLYTHYIHLYIPLWNQDESMWSIMPYYRPIKSNTIK